MFQQEGKLDVERGIIIRIVYKPTFSKFTAQRIVNILCLTEGDSIVCMQNPEDHVGGATSIPKAHLFLG